MTPKQARFADEYMVDQNATQAYIRAGYTARSGNVARVEGCRLLAKPSIAALVAEKRAVVAEKAELSTTWVWREWKSTYLRATAAEDYGPARAVLADIAKALGMFPREGALVDQRQVHISFNVPPLDED